MIKPLYDRILLEKVEKEVQTSSGILLPDSSKEVPSMAKVVAVGEGRVTDEGKLIPVDVKVGDVVIYKQYSVTEVNYENKDYMLIDMKDILAVVEKEI